MAKQGDFTLREEGFRGLNPSILKPKPFELQLIRVYPPLLDGCH